MKRFAGQEHGSAATLPAASFADGPIHNLKASAAIVASDPVSNISLLSQLQSVLESTETGQYQLQALATYIARILSSTVVCHNGTKARLDRDALHAVATHAHDDRHSSHHESAAQSRVGLAVLLLGVWADRLPTRLAFAHANLPEAAEDASCCSHQTMVHEVSAMPALINAIPAATAAGAFTTAFSSGAPALASESALESGSHDEVSPESPCSAHAVASIQSLPSSAGHMSMMASDSEEEEQDEKQKWVPDSLKI